jgi:hypothetical protein
MYASIASAEIVAGNGTDKLVSAYSRRGGLST